MYEERPAARGTGIDRIRLCMQCWCMRHSLLRTNHTCRPNSTSALPTCAGLDVLSAANGPIAAAQHAAAGAWGADASFFLVNGTTGGIHAAVLATCGPGDALILARNTHLSAFNAMVLAGCTPVYAQPTYDPQLGIAHQLTPAALAAAFAGATAAGLRVGAALVVSPTYFGVLSDIAGGRCWLPAAAAMAGGGGVEQCRQRRQLIDTACQACQSAALPHPSHHL